MGFKTLFSFSLVFSNIHLPISGNWILSGKWQALYYYIFPVGAKFSFIILKIFSICICTLLLRKRIRVRMLIKYQNISLRFLLGIHFTEQYLKVKWFDTQICACLLKINLFIGDLKEERHYQTFLIKPLSLNHMNPRKFTYLNSKSKKMYDKIGAMSYRFTAHRINTT